MVEKKAVKVPGAKCDFCNNLAEYDGPVLTGGWAYVCDSCKWRLAWSIKSCTKIDATMDAKMEEQNNDN